MSTAETDIARIVLAQLVGGGWKSIRARRKHTNIDELVVRDGLTYAVEIAAARESRSQQLQALLAHASLVARRAARELDAQPLAIVAAPRISNRVAAEIHAYANRYLDGAAYGIVDLGGRLELVGEGLEIERRLGKPRRDELDVTNGARFDLFTDLNQWLLKVLLAPRLPESLLRAPRDPVRNATELATAAKVSLPTAARFVQHLRVHACVDSEGERLRLLDIPALLVRLRAVYDRPGLEIPARFVLPKTDVLRQTLETVRRHYGNAPDRVGDRVCVGLFAAADLLGSPHARGVAPHVYHERPSSRFLASAGLARAGAGERVDLFVVRPRFPETLFRGAVLRHDTPVTDVVQTWVDVAHHPVRGREQAAHLWKTMLEPHFGEASH